MQQGCRAIKVATLLDDTLEINQDVRKRIPPRAHRAQQVSAPPAPTQHSSTHTKPRSTASQSWYPMPHIDDMKNMDLGSGVTIISTSSHVSMCIDSLADSTSVTCADPRANPATYLGLNPGGQLQSPSHPTARKRSPLTAPRREQSAPPSATQAAASPPRSSRASSSSAPSCPSACWC